MLHSHRCVTWTTATLLAWSAYPRVMHSGQSSMCRHEAAKEKTPCKARHRTFPANRGYLYLENAEHLLPQQLGPTGDVINWLYTYLATLAKATFHLSANPCLGTTLHRSTEMPQCEETGGLAPLPPKSASPPFSCALTHPAFPQQPYVVLSFQLIYPRQLRTTVRSYSYLHSVEWEQRKREIQKYTGGRGSVWPSKSCICLSRSRPNSSP